MKLQAVRDLLSELPFKPFRVMMASGERYDVATREAAFLTHLDLVVGTEIDEDGIPASFRICSLQQIAVIEGLK